MGKLILFGIIASLLFLTSVSASASYIQGKIYVSDTGKVIFDLEADPFDNNFEGVSFVDGKVRGASDSLTSKSGGIWEISFDFGEYDNILVDIYFPAGLERIVSISGTGSSINLRERSISIYDSGRMNLSAKYLVKESRSYSWVYWILSFFVIAGAYFGYKKVKSRRERLESAFSYLSDKEQKILESVIEKRSRQKELREKLGIPKASFTRYLLNLEKKRLVVREGEGKNKWVKAT